MDTLESNAAFAYDANSTKASIIEARHTQGFCIVKFSIGRVEYDTEDMIPVEEITDLEHPLGYFDPERVSPFRQAGEHYKILRSH